MHPVYRNSRKVSKNFLGTRLGSLKARSGGFCIQGALNCPTRRAFLCTLCTETPERAFEEPSGNQTGFLEARSGVCMFRVPSIVLSALLQKLVGEFFFDFPQGNLENLVGNLEGIFRGFFLTHRTKAQKFRGKFRSILRKKIRGSKKIFRGKFTLQMCHLSQLLFDLPNRQILRKLRTLCGRPIFIQCWYWEELCLLYEGAKPQPGTG